ncbi:alpha-2-macroglobulin family protein [Saccharicrinis aurantiacus]|uniref:alpha-2-macroglobulin family protein n=1 Tax=Saccharicrinis aurantiacus TaxID=1849719 RepID=UPI00094F577A|nr:MG2 domain-containing protein [Saccharicrinis aurantiacus]
MIKNSLRSWSLLLLISLIVSACNHKKGTKDKPDVAVTYSEEQAKEVSFVTSGDIHFDESIMVIFNNAIVDDSQVGKAVKEAISFSPSIQGQAIWKSNSVLQFVPEKPLALLTNYLGTLHFKKLSEKYKTKEVDDLDFAFNILGRDISSFNGSLELKNNNSPKELVYRGKIVFSEKTKLEAIEKAAKIKGGKATIVWSQVDDYNFQFTTSEIIRSDKSQDFKFEIRKEALELEHDYTESFVVSPLKSMEANSFKVDEDGRNPRVRVVFSDDLNMEQNIEGLISVKPSLEFSVKKLGKTAILDGNFKFGTKYTITINKGISSRWGTKTQNKVVKEVAFKDIPPQLEFASNGIILPSSNNKKVQFYTTNISRVHLQVKKVFTDRVSDFARSQQLQSSRTRNNGFKNNYESNVGVIVKSKTIEIGSTQNEWLLNEFDLTELFEKYDDGLFLIRINYTPEDMMKTPEEDLLHYVSQKGQIYKPVFLSDLGMTVKHTENGAKVFVTDIITGKLLSGVRVSLLNWSARVETSATTNSSGVASFSNNNYYYYVKAEYKNQLTFLNKSEMAWSNSGFNIGGVHSSRNNTKGFIYMERGVYRPGDSINISFIAKNNDFTFPRNHPVSITIRDPQYNTVFEHTEINGVDGMYVFNFKTEDNAPTGSYNVRINAGGSNFHKELKIETVVAEQLKVSVEPSKRQFIWTDKLIDFDIRAKYLFGAPASNLKAEATIEVLPYEIKFPKYKEFSFTREDADFNASTHSVLKSELDAEGNLNTSWFVPPLGQVPSALKLKISAKVLEKGGQPNEGWNFAKMHVYPNYVGIKDPSGYGYYKTGATVKFPVVLLNIKGEPVEGKAVQYKVYRNDKRWWYQYDSRNSYRLKYKEDNQTYLETEGAVTSEDGVAYINFEPSENGEYLIEVSDGGNGHSAAMFFSAYRYGSSGSSDSNEGSLALKADKDKYSPNETAKIKLPNPKRGNILVTLEQGNKMLDWFWVDPSKTSDDNLIIDIPLNKNMLPNVYVTVSVLQPHDQTINDRPIRMFGIIPLYVEDENTKLNYLIKTKENLVPNEDFTIDISTENGKQSQFTIAVVDEGLLSLTQFRTPSPWREFYKKIGLFVQSYDIFSQVISANKADVFQTFSIGGAEELDYRESQVDPIDGKKRFEPVSMFKGPIKTDSNGKARVSFHMPNYNGAVRVMVVGSQNSSFGSADKTIPVRSDIIMQPSIPRVLNPGDEFILPVALFNMNKKITQADFTITTEGPLEIIGSNKYTTDFSQASEADIEFKVRVKKAVGQAKILIKGQSGTIQVESGTNIKVVPSATRIYDKETHKITKGSQIEFNVPKVGMEGTNNASLDLSVFPNMDFNHRLKWLIRYPYGCVEQTTSAVFPQLMLKSMGYFNADEMKDIDTNINEGINRLQSFSLSNGGFSYWPGGTSISFWGTNYVTHFLVEAKKMGYAVPNHLYNSGVECLQKYAKRHTGNLMTRVNRVFILALADKTVMSEMNLLMENELSKMTRTQKWMLATAYHLYGNKDIPQQILVSADDVLKVYKPNSYSYGSKHRDDAIILYCATLMKKMNDAELVAKTITKKLSTLDYLSTQSSGYMLLSLGKYFKAVGIDAGNGQILKGSITLANGEKMSFSKAGSYSVKIPDNFGKPLKVELADGSELNQAYASLSWNGVPFEDEIIASAKNLKLEVKWYNENGAEINPQKLKQGAVFYGRFSVQNTSAVSSVNELALVQLIPSGWAIENTRLNGTLLPSWVRNWNINKEDYLDIRDDRVMWFFDLKDKKKLDFVVKLNCIHAGEFALPATLTEAMYNNDFKATTEGVKVHVESFK